MRIFYAVALVAGLLPALSAAQELTPRAYWPTPQGTRIATIGYSYVSGDTIPDPSLPITGVDSSISTLTLGYSHTVDLWGRTANLIFQLPYSDGDTRGENDFGKPIKRDYQGVGDASATVSVNLFGAPAMTTGEFSNLRKNPRPILGGSLKLVAPTGKYDNDRLINVGANRWAVKAELGLIVPLHRKWLLEADVGAWVFQDNDDFLGFTKEQKPIGAIQLHLVHRFTRGFWWSVDSSYYKGGRSKVEGRRLDDLQRDSKLGLTLVFPLARKNAIKVTYSSGSLRDDDESFDVVSLSYSRVL